jgi:hypothetical protein
MSLLRAAQTAKEILSANSDTPVTVEGIEPGRDFTTSVTRRDLESHCGGIIRRIVEFTKRSLVSAHCHAPECAVEVVGGASRIPLLSTALTASEIKVSRTLNGDEAVAHGAGYHAATISGFSILKSITYFDVSHRPVMISVGSSAPQLLFENITNAEARKTVGVRADKNVSLRLHESGALTQVCAIRCGDITAPCGSVGIDVEVIADSAGVVSLGSAILQQAANESKDEGNLTALNGSGVAAKPLVNCTWVGHAPLVAPEAMSGRSRVRALFARHDFAQSIGSARNELESLLIWARGEGFLKSTAFEAAFRHSESFDATRQVIESIGSWFDSPASDGRDDATLAKFRASVSSLRVALAAHNSLGDDVGESLGEEL